MRTARFPSSVGSAQLTLPPTPLPMQTLGDLPIPQMQTPQGRPSLDADHSGGRTPPPREQNDRYV